MYFTDQTVGGDPSLHQGGGGRDAPQHQAQGKDKSPLSLRLELNHITGNSLKDLVHNGRTNRGI